MVTEFGGTRFAQHDLQLKLKKLYSLRPAAVLLGWGSITHRAEMRQDLAGVEEWLLPSFLTTAVTVTP